MQSYIIIFFKNINLYINSNSPTHRFFNNNYHVLSRIHFGVVRLCPTSKGESFHGGCPSVPHGKLHKNSHSLWMKPPMAIKLAGGSHYVTSLFWVSLFGSSQHCIWLTGKIKAQKSFKHKLLPQIFSESHPTLLVCIIPRNAMAYSVALFSGTEQFLYLTLTKIEKKEKKQCNKGKSIQCTYTRRRFSLLR